MSNEHVWFCCDPCHTIEGQCRPLCPNTCDPCQRAEEECGSICPNNCDPCQGTEEGCRSVCPDNCDPCQGTDEQCRPVNPNNCDPCKGTEEQCRSVYPNNCDPCQGTEEQCRSIRPDNCDPFQGTEEQCRSVCPNNCDQCEKNEEECRSICPNNCDQCEKTEAECRSICFNNKCDPCQSTEEQCKDRSICCNPYCDPCQIPEEECKSFCCKSYCDPCEVTGEEYRSVCCCPTLESPSNEEEHNSDNGVNKLNCSSLRNLQYTKGYRDGFITGASETLANAETEQSNPLHNYSDRAYGCGYQDGFKDGTSVKNTDTPCSFNSWLCETVCVIKGSITWILSIRKPKSSNSNQPIVIIPNNTVATPENKTKDTLIDKKDDRKPILSFIRDCIARTTGKKEPSTKSDVRPNTLVDTTKILSEYQQPDNIIDSSLSEQQVEASPAKEVKDSLSNLTHIPLFKAYESQTWITKVKHFKDYLFHTVKDKLNNYPSTVIEDETCVDGHFRDDDHAPCINDSPTPTEPTFYFLCQKDDLNVKNKVLKVKANDSKQLSFSEHISSNGSIEKDITSPTDAKKPSTNKHNKKCLCSTTKDGRTSSRDQQSFISNPNHTKTSDLPDQGDLTHPTKEHSSNNDIFPATKEDLPTKEVPERKKHLTKDNPKIKESLPNKKEEPKTDINLQHKEVEPTSKDDLRNKRYYVSKEHLPIKKSQTTKEHLLNKKEHATKDHKKTTEKYTTNEYLLKSNKPATKEYNEDGAVKKHIHINNNNKREPTHKQYLPNEKEPISKEYIPNKKESTTKEDPLKEKEHTTKEYLPNKKESTANKTVPNKKEATTKETLPNKKEPTTNEWLPNKKEDAIKQYPPNKNVTTTKDKLPYNEVNKDDQSQSRVETEERKSLCDKSLKAADFSSIDNQFVEQESPVIRIEIYLPDTDRKPSSSKNFEKRSPAHEYVRITKEHIIRSHENKGDDSLTKESPTTKDNNNTSPAGDSLPCKNDHNPVVDKKYVTENAPPVKKNQAKKEYLPKKKYLNEEHKYTTKTKNPTPKEHLPHVNDTLRKKDPISQKNVTLFKYTTKDYVYSKTDQTTREYFSAKKDPKIKAHHPPGTNDRLTKDVLPAKKNSSNGKDLNSAKDNFSKSTKQATTPPTTKGDASLKSPSKRNSPSSDEHHQRKERRKKNSSTDINTQAKNDSHIEKDQTIKHPFVEHPVVPNTHSPIKDDSTVLKSNIDTKSAAPPTKGSASPKEDPSIQGPLLPHINKDSSSDENPQTKYNSHDEKDNAREHPLTKKDPVAPSKNHKSHIDTKPTPPPTKGSASLKDSLSQKPLFSKKDSSSDANPQVKEYSHDEKEHPDKGPVAPYVQLPPEKHSPAVKSHIDKKATPPPTKGSASLKGPPALRPRSPTKKDSSSDTNLQPKEYSHVEKDTAAPKYNLKVDISSENIVNPIKRILGIENKDNSIPKNDLNNRALEAPRDTEEEGWFSEERVWQFGSIVVFGLVVTPFWPGWGIFRD